MTDLKQLKEEIEKYGVPVGTFRRQKETIVTLENYASRKKVKINVPHGTDIEVLHGSKKLKQVLITFSEKSEIIDGNVYDHTSYPSKNKAKEGWQSKEIRNRILNDCPVKGCRILEIKSTPYFVRQTEYRNGTIYYKARVPARRNYFLIGYDETNTFICQLPKKVSTIKEAHEILRPKGISNKAIRVGEWFFDPVDDKTAAEVLSKTNSYDIEIDNSWVCSTKTVEEKLLPDFLTHGDVTSDNHMSSLQFYYKNNTYVMGLISDSRKTHKDIVLTSLHRVVKNRELVVDGDKWD